MCYGHTEGQQTTYKSFPMFSLPWTHMRYFVVGFILCIDKPNKTEKNIQIFIIPYFYMLAYVAIAAKLEVTILGLSTLRGYLQTMIFFDS